MRWSSTSKVTLLSSADDAVGTTGESYQEVRLGAVLQPSGQRDDTLADRHVDGLRIEKEQPPDDVLRISSSITSSGCERA